MGKKIEKKKESVETVQEIQREPLPEKIVATYVDDYNILELDYLVKKYYEKQEPEKYKNYLQENQTLLDEYNSLNKIPQVVVFGKPSPAATLKLSEEQLEKRYVIIETYLENVSKYIPIDIKRQIVSSSLCTNCNYSLRNAYVDENGMLNCPQCGLQKQTFSNSYYTISYAQNNFSNSNTKSLGGLTKNDHEERKNFITALSKYQCKQPTHFHRTLFLELDQYFQSKGLPIGAEVKNLPSNQNGTRGKTTRTMLLNALNQTGNSEYYVDCSLIGHMYFDWKAPDLSEIEDRVMRYYDIIQKALKQIECSGINIQFRMFKHLQQCGYRCTIDDFKIVKTPEILENLERSWKMLCEFTGLPYIPTI